MYKRIFLAILLSFFITSYAKPTYAAEMRCSKQKYSKLRVHHDQSFNLIKKPSSVKIQGTFDIPSPVGNYRYEVINKGVSPNGILILELALIFNGEGEPTLTSIEKMNINKTVWFGNIISAIKIDITGRDWGEKTLICQ